MSLPRCPAWGSRAITTKACHSCGNNFHKGGKGGGGGSSRSEGGQSFSGMVGGDKPPLKSGGLTRQQVETRWRREVGREPTPQSAANGLKRRLADEIAFHTDRTPLSKEELKGVSVRDMVRSARAAGVRPSWTPYESEHFGSDLKG